MDELNTRISVKEQLEWGLIILLILSGSIFDHYDALFNLTIDSWTPTHTLIRDIKQLGFSLLAFKALSYKLIKLKTLSLMFVLWSSVIIVYNAITPQNIHAMYTSTPFYGLYLWWLIRVASIEPERPSTTEELKRINTYSTHNAGVAYNILMPVSTFRGLLQILLTFNNPLYETRILIARNKMVAISKNEFIELPYSEFHAQSLIRKGGKIRVCKNYKQSVVNSLVGTKARLIFNDCRKLEL